MQRTGAVCQKAAAPLKAIGVTVSEESIRAYLEESESPRAPGKDRAVLRRKTEDILRLSAA